MLYIFALGNEDSEGRSYSPAVYEDQRANAVNSKARLGKGANALYEKRWRMIPHATYTLTRRHTRMSALSSVVSRSLDGLVSPSALGPRSPLTSLTLYSCMPYGYAARGPPGASNRNVYGCLRSCERSCTELHHAVLATSAMGIRHDHPHVSGGERPICCLCLAFGTVVKPMHDVRIERLLHLRELAFRGRRHAGSCFLWRPGRDPRRREEFTTIERAADLISSNPHAAQ